MSRQPCGEPVARLSRRAVGDWRGRLESVVGLVCEGLLRQGRDLGAAKFAARCRSEVWELPLVEVCWRAGP